MLVLKLFTSIIKRFRHWNNYESPTLNSLQVLRAVKVVWAEDSPNTNFPFPLGFPLHFSFEKAHT